MNEQSSKKPSEILLKMIAEYAETENNFGKKIQLSASIYVEIIDENHISVTDKEKDEEHDSGIIQIVLCEPKEVPKVKVFEVNTFEEDKLRRLAREIVWTYCF